VSTVVAIHPTSNIPVVLTRQSLEDYLVQGGYTEPSLVKMRPKYERVIRRMHERGFDDLDSDTAVNELVLIVQQMRRPEARDSGAEHHLRNLTGVREGRRWK